MSTVHPDTVCVKCGRTYANHRFIDSRRRCPSLFISSFKANPNGWRRPDKREVYS